MKDRFKQLRDATGLTQTEFGARIGVSRDVIANIEYGRVEPKDKLISHVCEIYGVDEQWIRSGEGELKINSLQGNKKVDEAIKIFQSLRPEFQEYALEQIRKLADLQDK